MTETSILSTEHEQAIGSLVVGVSKIDSILTDLICAFGETNILAALVMVHHQQFANKVDCLKALMRAHLGHGPDATPFFDLINEAKAVSDFRNTVVHAHWTVADDGTAYAVRFTARGEFKRTKKAVAAEEIREHAREAAAIAARLASLRDHLQGTTERSPPTHPEPENP